MFRRCSRGFEMCLEVFRRKEVLRGVWDLFGMCLVVFGQFWQVFGRCLRGV